MFRKYGTFTGGISLPDDKHATLHTSVQPCALPKRIRLPLSWRTDARAEVLVKPGDHVEPGQKLVRGETPGSDVYAPLAARVSELTVAQVPTREKFVELPAIELTDLNGPWEFQEEDSEDKGQFNWQQAEPTELRRRITEGNLPTHRLDVRPLSQWIDKALSHRCRMLAANAMENQPYVSCDHRMLAERGQQVLQGLAILARALEVKETLLVADQRRLDSYRPLLRSLRHYDIQAVALPHKYPIGADPILVKVLTTRETPPGGSTMQLGCAVVGPATCLGVYRWVVLGRHAEGRVITFGGEKSPLQGNFYVPFGSLCHDLIDGVPELIHGGPMVGLRCPPLSIVTPGTEAILALMPAPVREATPCIRCSWCTDYCPARLNVTALNDAFELGRLEQARRLGATACIECGVCSYLCPSCLPLSQRVKRLKQVLIRGETAPPTKEGR